MKSILDPSFKYTSSANTDIGKTFARIRRLQRVTFAAPPARSSAALSSDVVVLQRGVSTDEVA